MKLYFLFKAVRRTKVLSSFLFKAFIRVRSFSSFSRQRFYEVCSFQSFLVHLNFFFKVFIRTWVLTVVLFSELYQGTNILVVFLFKAFLKTRVFIFLFKVFIKVMSDTSMFVSFTWSKEKPFPK